MTISRKTATRALGVVLVMASLATAACGASGTSETSTADGGGGTLSASPIRVGVLANVSGQNTGEKFAPPVLEAWARDVNRKDGVAGHPVEFVVEDTKGDAATAATAAKRITADKSIVAAVVFDAYAEGVYAKAITAAGLPVIGGMGYAPNVWGAQPNWLSVATTFPSIANASMVLAKSLGDTSASWVVCAEVATCTGIGTVAEAAAKKLGLSYSGTVTAAAATPNYTAPCLALIKKKVGFINLGHQADVDVRFASDCKTQGYGGHFGMSAGSIEPSVMRRTDSDVKINLALSSFPWFAAGRPAETYRQVMKSQRVAQEAAEDPRAT